MLATRLLAFAAAILAGANAQMLKSTYSGSSGLNDAAKATGRYMGTATDAFLFGNVNNDAPYMAELKNSKDWGMITPANAMKPSSLENQKGVFTYSQADQLVAMAKANGQRIRCHTLLWHSQVPGWMNTGNNATMLQGLTEHITNVMTHFKDDCYAWDVVNEVVADSGGYRTSFWYNTAGPSFIAHAFNVANQVKQQLGLKVKLYYNDYGIERAGSPKTKFAMNMVKGLIAQGVKIDGVGLQSHFSVDYSPSQSELAGVMQQYAAMGVDVAVTELDEKLQSNPSQQQQQTQEKNYAAVTGACASVSRCVGVTIWDFDDSYSWIGGASLPFYAAGGKGSSLMRTIAYDGLMNGWTANGAVTVAPTQVPAPTTQPTSVAPAPTQTATTAPTQPPSNEGAKKWGQCGGNGWTGPTTCNEGSCVKVNDWYSQCQ